MKFLPGSPIRFRVNPRTPRIVISFRNPSQSSRRRRPSSREIKTIGGALIRPTSCRFAAVPPSLFRLFPFALSSQSVVGRFRGSSNRDSFLLPRGREFPFSRSRSHGRRVQRDGESLSPEKRQPCPRFLDKDAPVLPPVCLHRPPDSSPESLSRIPTSPISRPILYAPLDTVPAAFVRG